MNISTRLLIALATTGWVQPALAQQNPYAMANTAVQISQARQANAALMHQYTWNSRMEIIVQGQVKDVRINQVSFGPYGQLQRTVLNDQPASSGIMLPTPIGFLRRAVASDEKQELQQFLTGLQGLVELYTLPTTGKIFDFMASAVPSAPDNNGMVQLTGNNVVQPGDSLTLMGNAWTKHVRQIQVSTTFQGQAVQLSATFATIPVSGLNYAAFVEAIVPSKQMSVQVQNYNFARFGN